MSLQTLKILGRLLTYPGKEMVAAVPEMRELLEKDSRISKVLFQELNKLLVWLETKDILDVQEAFVSLFDRTPSLSLHLFEHVHGDSRDRGQAMVDLDMLYREEGLMIGVEETPDYLPLFLEYLSILPSDQAQENLGGAINVIAAIGVRLEQRRSYYASVFKALESLSVNCPDTKAVESALLADAGTALTSKELDAAWEEQFALETPPSGGGDCPKVRDMLARMEKPIAETSYGEAKQ